jgi:hypothetical protein
MPNPEAIRLRHMREAAAAALELANGRERRGAFGLCSLWTQPLQHPEKLLWIMGRGAHLHMRQITG